MYPRWAKAQKYAAEGFQPVDSFAGQVRVRGKRITQEPFSIFLPDATKKCCGALVANSRTDKHGHFVVEPLQEGKYFVQFRFKGAEYVARFAILKSYDRCAGADYLQVDFAEPNKARIQESIWINDSGQECKENEPQCFRK